MEMFRKRQAELAAKAKQGQAPGAPGQAPAPANATAQQKAPPTR
jgi:hypothetical protein